MPSQQQKYTEKDSERYLISGPNDILNIFRWNDRSFYGCDNVCWWFLNRCKQLLGSCLSYKMFEMEFQLLKLIKIIVFSYFLANQMIGSSEYNISFAQAQK